MPIESLVALAPGVVALIAVITLFRQSKNHAVEAEKRMVSIEVKVDTMWDFQMRRALSESIHKGIATINSPLTVTPEAKAWMHGLAEQLRDFYAKLGHRMTDRELALEIERRFGDEILHKVCIPNGLYEGACLIIAMEIAKEVIGGES